MLGTDSIIQETNKYNDIVSYVIDGTLFVSDIDDTLYKYGQMLGTDAWFGHYLDKRTRRGMNEDEAKKITLEKLAEFIGHIEEVEPVEAVIPSIISRFQEKNIQTMGLTSRNVGLKKATESQFSIVGISFNQGIFKDKKFDLPKIGENCQFSKGVAYTDGGNKGEALVDILERLEYTPKRIVFVDDKRHHLVNVKKALESHPRFSKIPYFGFRYGAMDEEVKNLDPRVVYMQLQYFHRKGILNNAEALALWKLKNKHQKRILGVTESAEDNQFLLWGQLRSVNEALLEIERDLKKQAVPSFYDHLNGGNDKLCWGFKVSKSQLRTLKPKLEEKGLLQETQKNDLDRLLHTSPYNLRPRRNRA